MGLARSAHDDDIRLQDRCSVFAKDGAAVVLIQKSRASPNMDTVVTTYVS